MKTCCAGSPRDVGSEAEEWTDELLYEKIYDAFDVEFSAAHVHRLFVT